MINYEELYKPYAGVATLAETLGWLQKQATNLGIGIEVMNKAVDDTFLEMSNGKTFNKNGKDSGFENIPHADLNHYLLKKMIMFHDVSKKAYIEATNGFIQAPL